MKEQNIDEIISALYDLIQDARSLPLGADKCIIERDKALDLLDEIIAQMPGELKQARTVVESRNELISQARHEAEGMIRKAQEQAAELVKEEAIYQEAKNQCRIMFEETQAKMTELRKLSTDYMDDALRRTEEAIAISLEDVRDTRAKFKSLIESQERRESAVTLTETEE